MRRLLAILIVVVAGCTAGEGAKAPKAKATKTTKSPARSATRTSTSAPAPVVYRSFKAMGTQITLTVVSGPSGVPRAVFEDAYRELVRVEHLMTVWRPNSDIARLNAKAGVEPVSISDETMAVLRFARTFSDKSGGKFDVTFGALSGLWKFDHDQDDVLPDLAEVKRRTALIDYRDLILDEARKTAFLERKGMRAHVGGIGKGYGVDRIVALLRGKHGLKHFMVQAGGDLYVAGTRGNRPWRVGIRDPRGEPSNYFAAAEVTDATFSTSGDYERFFIKDGRRYHHIIDPDTGMPASGCRSVTVMAPDAMTADALSTAVFLVGPEAGEKLVDSVEGAGALIVSQDNRVIITRRLEGRIKVLHPPTPGV